MKSFGQVHFAGSSNPRTKTLNGSRLRHLRPPALGSVDIPSGEGPCSRAFSSCEQSEAREPVEFPGPNCLLASLHRLEHVLGRHALELTPFLTNDGHPVSKE